jgi:hypothetical protein
MLAFCKHCSKPSCSIKGKEFLDWLRKDDSAPWRLNDFTELVHLDS